MTRSKAIGRRVLALALSTLACFAATSASAQVQVRDIPRPAMPHAELPLGTTEPPAAAHPESWMMLGSGTVVHNVSTPTLTPFLPPRGKGNGTAIVIAPGGGFMMLSMSSEGWDVARWLQSHGIAAFVLKYRLAPTPPAAKDAVGAIVSALQGSDRATRLTAGSRIATQDAMAAMRLVRSNATKWGIDPHKVGFLGFSAGAYTTLSLAGTADADTKPDFIAPIYGPLGAPLFPIPSSPPPMWTAISADDPAVPPTELILPTAWRAKGGTVEFHMFENGGHGWGFNGTPGSTNTQWPTLFLRWLAMHHFAQ